jgi:drug/metabolite transporter superfamily protein YnfA
VKIGKDKILHFIAGFIIGIVFGILCGFKCGIAWAAGAGIAKEIIWDWLLKKGTPEVMDAVATIIGGIIGASISVLLT